jgi:hypothetical protein
MRWNSAYMYMQVPRCPGRTSVVRTGHCRYPGADVTLPRPKQKVRARSCHRVLLWVALLERSTGPATSCLFRRNFVGICSAALHGRPSPGDRPLCASVAVPVMMMRRACEVWSKSYQRPVPLPEIAQHQGWSRSSTFLRVTASYFSP